MGQATDSGKSRGGSSAQIRTRQPCPWWRQSMEGWRWSGCYSRQRSVCDEDCANAGGLESLHSSCYTWGGATPNVIGHDGHARHPKLYLPMGCIVCLPATHAHLPATCLPLACHLPASACHLPAIYVPPTRAVCHDCELANAIVKAKLWTLEVKL